MNIQTVRKKIPKEKLTRARELYFAGIYPTEIAQALDIDMDDLGVLVFGEDAQGRAPSCWSQQRQQRLQDGALTNPSEYKKVKSSYITQVESGMMRLLQESITEHLREGKKLSIFEIEKFTAAIERLDKINRLEEGLATEHIGVQFAEYSQKEIIEYRRNNTPYMSEDVEAEFQHLKDNAETGSVLLPPSPPVSHIRKSPSSQESE